MNEGTECRLTICPEKYFAPIDRSKMTCKASIWDTTMKCALSNKPCAGNLPTIPSGSVKCSNTDIVLNDPSISYYDGTRCTFSCNAGWIVHPPHNSPQIQCNDGTWANSNKCVKGAKEKLLIQFILLFQ